jgi:hypothetical protein
MTITYDRPRSRPAPAAPGEAYHHGSHRRLLARADAAPQGRTLDAIVVPSARPVGSLDNVIALARHAKCTLVVLCSGRSRAGEVAARAGGDSRVTAIDVAGARRILPALETTALHRSSQPHQPGDISVKRNLGLILARSAGWRRILFLDDDIEVPRPADLAEVAAVASGFDAVGLDNVGFHDNSVVCHAYRHIGGRQDTFIGGGAMVVRPHATVSFFPEIYNEDWLFFLRNTSLGSVASHGTVIQQPFDPFDSPSRAASQEFGDCIAEGIYWLLDHGSPIRHADAAYWHRALQRRRSFIDLIRLRMVNAPDPAGARRSILASLDAARDAHAFITPKVCAGYMQAWHRDRAAWRRYLRSYEPTPVPRSAEAACRDIGIPVNCDLRPAAPRSMRLSPSPGSLTVDEWHPSSDPLKIEISARSNGSSGRRSFSDGDLISSGTGTESS